MRSNDTQEASSQGPEIVGVAMARAIAAATDAALAEQAARLAARTGSAPPSSGAVG